MAELSSHALPLVDISPFLDPTLDPESRARTIDTLRSALHTHGFFYLTSHSLPTSLTTQVISLARTFFTTASPSAKAAIQRRDPGTALGDGARGYQKIGENVTYGHRDWHEAIDWYAEISAGEGVELGSAEEEKNNAAAAAAAASTSSSSSSSSITPPARPPPYPLLSGPNLWPASPAGFRAAYETYVSECRRLGAAVLRAMGEALGLRDPDTFVRAVENSFWVMRAIGYPPLDAELAKGGGVSCGEHSDYGCLTLLLDDGTRGALQVFLRDGEDGKGGEEGVGEGQGQGRWVDVQPVEGALVVNVGDMVERWTGGQVRSTRHRVVHTGKNFRVSVPFFLEPGREVVVECLDEFKEGMEERIRTGEVQEDIREPLRYWDHLVAKVGGNFANGED